MIITITAKSNAKINLHLDIFPKTDTGLHPLYSIMQKIELADTLTFTARVTQNDSLRINGNFPFEQRQNIISRAVNLYRRKLAVTFASQKTTTSISIDVVKVIPFGGGLGGGSANAATTLLTLNELYGRLFSRRLEQPQLLELAQQLGSDVSFFFADSTAALVTGCGEQIKELPPRNDYSLLLINPDFQIATEWAYKQLDILNCWPVSADGQAVDAYLHSPPEHWAFRNSFRQLLFSHYPIYRQLSDLCSNTGAIFNNISGSGATFLAVYNHIDQKSKLKLVHLLKKLKKNQKITFFFTNPI